ncbi:hypothetical protein [Romboutsia timonensis]|uniref:hypothetical protein n=1 Tax=Romboutsia timonensis TaxID=1776391 RepID=UPI002A7FE152|nr:hypothetical protein [Romboutsia timonensis]MDY3960961.1 hypothetical protein [Romboutsia timonensis]
MGFIYKKLINMTLVASSLSYWICLFVAMTCVLLSMAGSSKAKTGASISVIIYTVIQCILSVF